MTNLEKLKDERSFLVRASKNLLREKGSTGWNKIEGANFDVWADRIDDLDKKIDAIEKPLEAFDLFVRKDFRNMSDHERDLVAFNFQIPRNSTVVPTIATTVSNEFVSLYKDASALRRVSSQILAETGGLVNIPTSDGTNEVGEMLALDASPTAQDVSFGLVALATFKFSSKKIVIPNELLQDSATDISAFILQRAADRIARAQNLKFTVGVGATEPVGFVNQATIGKIGSTGQILTVIYEDLVDLQDSVDAGHPSLNWMMSQETRRMVRRIKDTAGRPIWEPGEFSGPSGNGVAGTLFNCPVNINNDMPVPAANAKSIAFGNFKKFLIRDVNKVIVRRMTDSAFALSNQVGFLVVAMSGATLLDTSAIKVYRHSAT
jgi:HK97 family phage major capsid protein